MKINPATKRGQVIVELNPKDKSILGAGQNSHNKPTPFKLKKILVPIDFSGCSKKELEIAEGAPEERLLQVSEALDHLAAEQREAARVVKLRYFAGLTNPQVAETMGISLRSVERHWTWAKAWLFRWIREQEKH